MRICFIDEVGDFRIIPGVDGQVVEHDLREPDYPQEVYNNAMSEYWISEGVLHHELRHGER